MPLLLTILSVLALLALLSVLIFGLLFIIKTLQGIRTRLELITMGVRAIEQQVHPLGERVNAGAAGIDRLAAGFGSLTGRLRGTDRSLATASTALRARLSQGGT
jgi:hypothetical protein